MNKILEVIGGLVIATVILFMFGFGMDLYTDGHRFMGTILQVPLCIVMTAGFIALYKIFIP